MTLSATQEQIISCIDNNATSSQWKDWKWQMRHSIKDLETFEALLDVKLSEKQRKAFGKAAEKFPISITPYYLSLINTEDMENDPVFLQSVPSPLELNIVKGDMSDPLHEDSDSPAPCVTHRYPDRVLLLVSNVCPMYCRHCTRKRKVGDEDTIPKRSAIEQGIRYIRNNPQIRDVLLSGGDPFLLSDDYLDWILGELRKIEHVEIIRIGTRTPVVLPCRITSDLVAILKKHQPVWVNTHFNHSREITQSARNALGMLADGGVPLGNQTVLLSGINDYPAS